MVWYPRVLTVAGSDSGGGAGIQADLKTFSALGVFGMSAITAITAQNTYEVRDIVKIPPESVRAQIRAVVEDIGVDAVKTGMLFSTDIIEVVAEELSKLEVPIVVDPVMVAKSGARLLKEDAIEVMKGKMFPLAHVITPNLPEAEVLSGMKIKDESGMRKAAEIISELGAKAVLVKGGHLRAVDVLYHEGEFYKFEADKVETKNTHGTGCSFASAIAAYLAKGYGLIESVDRAKKFITLAVKFGLGLGRGSGPVNHMAQLYREAERYKVIEELHEAIRRLEAMPYAGMMVPECQVNFGYALSLAVDRNDVAAVPGRIVRLGTRMKAVSHPEFGASKHIAEVILEAMKVSPEIRSAMDLKYDEEFLNRAKGLGMKVSHFDRREEPEEVGKKEGMTMRWGTRVAIQRAGGVPDIIIDLGGWGKEPMIFLLGRNPKEVLDKFERILGTF